MVLERAASGVLSCCLLQSYGERWWIDDVIRCDGGVDEAQERNSWPSAFWASTTYSAIDLAHLLHCRRDHTVFVVIIKETADLQLASLEAADFTLE